MITHSALVMTTPMWFLPYAGLTAAPMALTLGGALAVLLWWSRSIRWLPPTLVGIAMVGILVLAYPMRDVAGDRGGGPVRDPATRAGRRLTGGGADQWTADAVGQPIVAPNTSPSR